MSQSASSDGATHQTMTDESLPYPRMERSSIPSSLVPLSSLTGIGSRSNVIDSTQELFINPFTIASTPVSVKKLLLNRIACSGK